MKSGVAVAVRHLVISAGLLPADGEECLFLNVLLETAVFHSMEFTHLC